MKKSLLLLSLFLFNSVLSQTKEKPKQTTTTFKEITMEYFNDELYKDWEIDTKWSLIEDHKFLKKGNERISILFHKDNIQVTKSSVLDPYKKILMYNQKSRLLQASMIEFYQTFIGVAKYYNPNGTLKEEIDHDVSYSFSLKQVIEKIKQQYDLDLEDQTQGATLSREIKKEYVNPIYEVYMPSKEFANKTDYVLLDGKTGEILYETSYQRRLEKRIPFFNEYLLSLEKQKKEDNAPYKTYKGKSYTKKEWEIFEEEWYQNYEKKKNTKGFWGNIFE